jgi:cobaltochelatase CobS
MKNIYDWRVWRDLRIDKFTDSDGHLNFSATDQERLFGKVLAEKTFTMRRLKLRSLLWGVVPPPFSDFGSVRQVSWDEAFEVSPLVGDGEQQVKVAKTDSAVAGMLDIPTMVALIGQRVGMLRRWHSGVAGGGIVLSDVCKAIHSPESHGTLDSGGKTKTGYVFGRPRSEVIGRYDLITHRIIALEFNLNRKLDGDIGMNLDLQTCIEVIDIVEAKGWVRADIYKALSQITGDKDDHWQSVEAALAMSPKDRELVTGGKASEIADKVEMILDKDHDDTVEQIEFFTDEGGNKYAVDGDTALLDLALKQSGLPTAADIVKELNGIPAMIKEAEEKIKATAIAVPKIVETRSSDGIIPEGKVIQVKAKDAFKLTKGGEAFEFDVPAWKWDGDHPHVPEVDEGYIFRPFELMRLLYAILGNHRCYLHGHTGSGKTTLVEQVAARLNWPFMRVNFDSEITRMDLIGRDVLTVEGGATKSSFIDGILPQMMSGPYIGCFDEIDFVRPDVGYVMQRALEGNGLLLTEDGGRMVRPHPMFRMIATGNTVGQGDELGMYQGARPQSLALLDRFTTWIHVQYMGPEDRAKLIATSGLAKRHQTKICKYVTEHLEAFTGAKVLQPISPRGYLALCDAVSMFTKLFPKESEKEALAQAIEMVVLDRATATDRVVLKGIVNRVFG